MKKISSRIFVIMLMFVISIVAACSSDSVPEDSSSDIETAPTVGGDLNIGVVSDPVSLDPHGANETVSNTINATIYDRLVYMDQNSEIQPGLAESLEQIEDTVWEAKIREGVTFHDGAELNAEAVKLSLDRVRDPEVAAPVAFLFGMVTDVRVVDEFTVHIETEFPFAPLPAHLAHTAGSIISPILIEQSYEDLANGENPFAAANEHPAGTGYFKFVNQVPGNSVTLSKNEDYWHEEQAKVDTVTFKVIPESLTRIAELETGEIDINFTVSPSDVSRIESNPDTEIEQVNSTRMVYLGFNTEVEPFNDVNVRRALHMAIDKEALVAGILDGIGIPAHTPIAPGVFGYSEGVNSIEYDVEQAKELLAEAGYSNGLEVTLLTDDERERQDLAVALQAQLEEIGVNVTIDTYEFGTYIERAGLGQMEIFLGSWGTVTIDADYGLYAVFHSSNVGPPGNRSRIVNEELDELLDAARQETDAETRIDLYAQVQNKLAEESPYAYLYFPDNISATRSNVEGFWQYPSGYFFLRDVSLKQ
ncbi:glutathione ABC transporter substrate-binding protein [Alkalihalobacillus sp. MEB130]|uniref:glutathione ABC transporter substrate-binding protein n=1 Tax=Alkalihalobacillus sp. MEB130 TaxID=2976704 RepID=UPI0028DFAD2F|nr:glutathione ABC transporter substrate-binding protein [Alkalihalobacillus sp. MEB130]MDT8861180.1 glutathione ABC transporter substrate-binding protein [Alkalihalobacillus sp. MEB130]